jgi:hypothetical protein
MLFCALLYFYFFKQRIRGKIDSKTNLNKVRNAPAENNKDLTSSDAN